MSFIPNDKCHIQWCDQVGQPGHRGYRSLASRPRHRAMENFLENYPHVHGKKEGTMWLATQDHHMQWPICRTLPGRPCCTAFRWPGCIHPRLCLWCSVCVCGWRVVVVPWPNPSLKWLQSWRHNAWGCALFRRLFLLLRTRPPPKLHWGLR